MAGLELGERLGAGAVLPSGAGGDGGQLPVADRLHVANRRLHQPVGGGRVTAQVAGQLALTYLPVMNRLFQTAPITGGAWLRILILALAANLLLAAGIAANVVYLAYDPPWVRSLGDLGHRGSAWPRRSASGRCSRAGRASAAPPA